MAELKYCSNCESQQDVTKKGFNKSGEQLWLCKNCGKKFTAITAPKKAAKTTTSKTTNKVVEKSKKVTEIVVNSNTIKTVDKTLDIDQAFEMVSSYFKEIAKEKATINTIGDKTVITFKIAAGNKG